MKHTLDIDIINATIVTPEGFAPVHGIDMNHLTVRPDSFMRVRDGWITDIGPMSQYIFHPEMPYHDAGGHALLPGFVDSHTHLLFGGSRAEEFRMRMRGASYMDIMDAGGGINNTVKATRAASEEKLASKARTYLREMKKMGITTTEIKSGYGLDVENEKKMLNAIATLGADPRLPKVVPTFMGAHAIPNEFKGRTDDYVDYIINEMLPQCAPLAEMSDVFCEKGVFTPQQSQRILKAARHHGHSLKIHADEISCLDGALLATSLNAISADHLLHVSPKGIEALASSPTVATLLPLTAFVLKEPYAPARKLIDAGAAVALASDFNPGSCFSFSIPLIIALATLQMGMTLEETITALTLNGAAALGRAHDTGSIEVGKQADFIILKFKDYNFLNYHTGINCVQHTYVMGLK